MIPKWKEQFWLGALCFTLAACAIPFGAVTANWSFALRAVLVTMLLGAFLLGLVTEISKYSKVSLLAILGVALLGGLQALPLPVFVVNLVSPNHSDLVGRVAELMGETRRWIPLTVSRELTVASVGAWLSAGCALFLGLIASRLRARHWVYFAAAISALFQVVYGVGQWWGQSSKILGREVAGDLTRVRGTFVNPDHFSLHLEIVLALIPAIAWWLWRRTRRRFDVGRAIIVLLPLVGFWILLSGAVALSGSRAGLAAVAAGLVAQGLLLVIWGRDRVSGVIVLGGGAVAGISLILLTAGQGFTRLVGTTAYQVTANLRWTVFRSSFDLWQAYPIFGSGLGTFVAAYPRFQPAAAESAVWRHAHNGWVEMLVTTGVVGASIVSVGVVAVVGGLRDVLRNEQRTKHRAAALAALGVLVTVALHETFEFGLTMPANATLMAVLIGLGLGTRSHVHR